MRELEKSNDNLTENQKELRKMRMEEQTMIS